MNFIIYYLIGALSVFILASVFNRIPLIKKHSLVCPGDLVLYLIASSWIGLFLFICTAIWLILNEITDYYSIKINFDRLYKFIEGKKDD